MFVRSKDGDLCKCSRCRELKPAADFALGTARHGESAIAFAVRAGPRTKREHYLANRQR